MTPRDHEDRVIAAYVACGYQEEFGRRCFEANRDIFGALLRSCAADALEAAAELCESRARSLLHQSKRPSESNEAFKCATGIRSMAAEARRE